MLKYKNDINEIGIDEAGRGPLIGRVYAGAVIWNNNLECDLIKDSKKLSKKKRKQALEWIEKNIKYWAFGYADEKEIDDVNILQATKLAMDRALEQLHQKTKVKNDKTFFNTCNQKIIIDGYNWEKLFKHYDVESVIKGDNKYYSIAAASIVAKEYHDMYIKDLVDKEPELNEKYDLLSNMGYPTKKHRDGVKKYGISKYHRRTFKLK